MAWFDTRLARLVGTRYPLIQAPMAGVNTPELVAAVSNAGGLGSLGGAMLSPDVLREQLAAVRRLTTSRSRVNLFAPLTGAPRTPAAVDSMLERIAPWRERLGLGPGTAPPVPAALFEAQLEVVLADPPAVFSITFGLPPAEALAALRDAGVTVVGTATTSAEAVGGRGGGLRRRRRSGQRGRGAPRHVRRRLRVRAGRARWRWCRRCATASTCP